MRLAIVSDTHMPRGTRRLPDSCVEHCRSADAILHCGDFMRLEVLDLFEQFGPPVHAVFGNVDAYEVRDRLPYSTTVELEGVRIGMVHDPGAAAGRARRLRDAFDSAAAVLFGHTHLPQHETLDDGFQIFNPGSPTERRRAPTHTKGLGTIDAGTLTLELVEL